MNVRTIGVVIASLAATTILSSQALAQEPDPGHPRINQVQNYVNTQEQNTMKAEEAGKITPAQANRDMAHDQHIQDRLDKDESKHGGHITKGEQRRLDHSLNKNRARRHRQKEHDLHK